VTSDDLGLAGVVNARDLGGHRTIEGARVRHRRVFRSNSLVRATEADLAVLSGLGLRRVIDLRGETELASFGVGPEVTDRVHLPMGDAARDIIAAMSAGGQGSDDGVAHTMMLAMYRGFVVDDSARSQLGVALRLLAAADGLPVLFHCTAGKDRTGWLAAVTLSILGVDREAVLDDYLETNVRFTTGHGAASRAELLSSLRTVVDDVACLMPLLDARPEYLAAAFDEAVLRYGSFDAYVRLGLGADVEGLRATLLTSE
jgi:protein-tyrosine phosphatase